jgi:general secretion pathway protein G
MLVVIAIIGLIAAILTPGLMNQLGRAKAKAAQLQLDSTAAAVELFRSDVGRYPMQSEGLSVLVNEPANVEGWTGPYIKDPKVLSDPWNNPIRYVAAADGRSFYVESLGADGKPGGSGMDRDLRSPTGPRK